MFVLVRKNYFIKKGLQTRFIGTVFLIIALVVVVLFCNLYFFGLFLAQDDTEQKYESAMTKLQEDVRDKLAGRLALLILVNITIIALISLFFSHQIAGPVYKLEMTLQKIIDGDASVRFSFRQSDKFDEVADLLNDMKDGFVEPLKLVRDVNLKALPLIEEAIAKKDARVSEAALSQLKEMHSQIANSILEMKFEAPQKVEVASNDQTASPAPDEKKES